MHKRKRTCMAFRPCLTQIYLEDRLVLSITGASPAIQAIANHAVLMSPNVSPAALVSTSSTSSAISPAGSDPLAGSTGTAFQRWVDRHQPDWFGHSYRPWRWNLLDRGWCRSNGHW